jgi:hypothetical protein
MNFNSINDFKASSLISLRTIVVKLLIVFDFGFRSWKLFKSCKARNFGF